MESNCLSQSFSNACPPVYTEDYSLFFNLILGIKFENTKDNCLQFLKNYSKNIFLPKRQLFMFLINELTLNKINDNMSKGLGNNESIYLIRQLIKKYSRNNIINALYDFISVDDNDFIPPGNDNNLINSTFDSSMNQLQSSQSERDSKFEYNNLGQIQENQGEEDKEKNNNDNENESKSERKKNQFLSRKRKLANSQKKNKNRNNKNKAKAKQNNKKRKKFKKIKKSQKELNEKFKEKKVEEKHDDMNNDDEKYEEKEEIENNIKKEKQKEEDEGSKDNEEEKEEEKEINEYKKKLRRRSPNKDKKDNNNNSNNNTTSAKKSGQKRCVSPTNSIQKEINNKLDLWNSMDTQLNKRNSSNKKDKDKNQLDIISYLNRDKSLNSNSPIKSPNDNNKFSCHLIKFPQENDFVYSYKMKRYQNINNNIIYFECNNKVCKGKGEYDINNKIFIETNEHDVSKTKHKISSFFYCLRDKLLEDKDTNGYQIFKDNKFIKDKKTIFLKQ